MTPSECCDQLRDALLAGRNPDGGWGYYAGKRSRLEPTCWALLSLVEERNPGDASFVELGVRLLATWQRKDGLLAESQLPVNLAFNGFASVVLTAMRSVPMAPRDIDGVGRRLVEGIAGAKSGTVWNWNSLVRQDNSLVGWPWTEGAFAWVEPTAWCTLALKMSPDREPALSEERIQEAERLLLDRQCESGGWNYGNSEVLGQKLHAYVPPTALVLLSLRDRRDSPQLRRALDFLLGSWRTERAGMALGLSLLCLRGYGVPAKDAETALAIAWQTSGFLGNHSVMGLARYALTAGSNAPTALWL